MKAVQTRGTIIHCNAPDMNFEVAESINVILNLMYDSMLDMKLFICLHFFDDGEPLYIKKDNIIAFYEIDNLAL